jgi:L,D-transpeptidase catalytic domain
MALFEKFRKSVPMKLHSTLRWILPALIVAAPMLLTGSEIFRTSLPATTVSSVMEIPVPTDPTEEKTSSLKEIAQAVYQEIGLNAFNLDQQVFEQALKGFDKLTQLGKLGSDSILTIVDFSKPSTEKRLFVIDLKEKKVRFNTYVAHGQGSGDAFAKKFSNTHRSHQSSLGFYVTKGTYRGENGYSLKLEGVERGFNDNAMRRAIVVHGARYAEPKIISGQGKLGRSWGCPAVPMSEHKPIINTIKDGTCLFVYSPDKRYLQMSQMLNG